MPIERLWDSFDDEGKYALDEPTFCKLKRTRNAARGFVRKPVDARRHAADYRKMLCELGHYGKPRQRAAR